MYDESETRIHLEASLAALAERAQTPVKAVPQGRASAAASTMTLPDGLAREAAIMVFEFWEANSPAEPMSWDKLPTKFQMMWIDIVQIILKMSADIMLTDIHRFFEMSNGDMGAAFAKALRRYAAEVLHTKINP